MTLFLRSLNVLEIVCVDKDIFEAPRTFLDMKAQKGEAVTFEQAAHRVQEEQHLFRA